MLMFFSGCSNKEIKKLPIYDLVNIPQDVTYFSDIIFNKVPINATQNEYKKKYFYVWNIDKPKKNLNTVKWAFQTYKFGKSYGENLQLLKEEFFNEMFDSANFSKFATLNKKAIMLKDSNIRAFPTIRPLFMNPSMAGEGFPFDYLQNSTISANKPIFISHYSKDREWAHIFSGFAFGWVKTDELVIIDKKYSDLLQKTQQVQIIKEGVPIYDDSGEFLFKSKIGMMFALISQDDKTYTILTISSQSRNRVLLNKSKISKSIASKDILTFNRDNLNNIINEVSKTNYGWGGIYGQRDCSSMLRDMFAPFGIWLPRNSLKQSKIGKIISFDNMNNNQKIKLIKDKAIPFQTLLYKRGHIVLYVGKYNDEIVVFHNMWGIKTKKDDIEGRIVIGKPIFSSLKVGNKQKNYDKDSEILKNLKSMNILIQ
jgi:hypothetical protein